MEVVVKREATLVSDASFIRTALIKVTSGSPFEMSGEYESRFAASIMVYPESVAVHCAKTFDQLLERLRPITDIDVFDKYVVVGIVQCRSYATLVSKGESCRASVQYRSIQDVNRFKSPASGWARIGHGLFPFGNRTKNSCWSVVADEAIWACGDENNNSGVLYRTMVELKAWRGAGTSKKRLNHM